MWEIAELKKPYSDLDNSDLIESIRELKRKKYRVTFADEVPSVWRDTASKGECYNILNFFYFKYQISIF